MARSLHSLLEGLERGEGEVAFLCDIGRQVSDGFLAAAEPLLVEEPDYASERSSAVAGSTGESTDDNIASDDEDAAELRACAATLTRILRVCTHANGAVRVAAARTLGRIVAGIVSLAPTAAEEYGLQALESACRQLHVQSRVRVLEGAHVWDVLHIAATARPLLSEPAEDALLRASAAMDAVSESLTAGSDATPDVHTHTRTHTRTRSRAKEMIAAATESTIDGIDDARVSAAVHAEVVSTTSESLPLSDVDTHTHTHTHMLRALIHGKGNVADDVEYATSPAAVRRAPAVGSHPGVRRVCGLLHVCAIDCLGNALRPQWQLRQAAFMCLTALIEGFGGPMPPVEADVPSRALRTPYLCARVVSVCVCLIALDRFGDFSSAVHARPVLEALCPLLRYILRMCDTRTLQCVHGALVQLTSAVDWHARSGAWMGLRCCMESVADRRDAPVLLNWSECWKAGHAALTDEQLEVARQSAELLGMVLRMSQPAGPALLQLLGDAVDCAERHVHTAFAGCESLFALAAGLVARADTGVLPCPCCAQLQHAVSVACVAISGGNAAVFEAGLRLVTAALNHGIACSKCAVIPASHALSCTVPLVARAVCKAMCCSEVVAPTLLTVTRWSADSFEQCILQEQSLSTWRRLLDVSLPSSSLPDAETAHPSSRGIALVKLTAALVQQPLSATSARTRWLHSAMQSMCALDGDAAHGVVARVPSVKELGADSSDEEPMLLACKASERPIWHATPEDCWTATGRPHSSAATPPPLCWSTRWMTLQAMSSCMLPEDASASAPQLAQYLQCEGAPFAFASVETAALIAAAAVAAHDVHFVDEIEHALARWLPGDDNPQDDILLWAYTLPVPAELSAVLRLLALDVHAASAAHVVAPLAEWTVLKAATDILNAPQGTSNASALAQLDASLHRAKLEAAVAACTQHVLSWRLRLAADAAMFFLFEFLYGRSAMLRNATSCVRSVINAIHHAVDPGLQAASGAVLARFCAALPHPSARVDKIMHNVISICDATSVLGAAMFCSALTMQSPDGDGTATTQRNIRLVASLRDSLALNVHLLAGTCGKVSCVVLHLLRNQVPCREAVAALCGSMIDASLQLADVGDADVMVVADTVLRDAALSSRDVLITELVRRLPENWHAAWARVVLSVTAGSPRVLGADNCARLVAIFGALQLGLLRPHKQVEGVCRKALASVSAALLTASPADWAATPTSAWLASALPVAKQSFARASILLGSMMTTAHQQARHVPFSQRLQASIQEPVDHASDNAYDSPSSWTALRGYQVTGARWIDKLLASGLHPLLADEMGLGKTVQVLAAMHLRSIAEPAEFRGKISLVACPASVCGHWKHEIATWSKLFGLDCAASIVQGGVVPIVALPTSHVVWIVSYAAARTPRLLSMLREQSWEFVVLDEAHVLRSPDSMTRAAIASLAAAGRYRIACTGTPVHNAPTDLWSVMELLMPGCLGPLSEFTNCFVQPLRRASAPNASEAVVNSALGALTRLQTTLLPYILRRTKAEVLRELPSKLIQDVVVDMPDEQRSAYAAVEARVRGGELTGFAATSALIAACNHPVLVQDTTGRRAAAPSLHASGKLAALLDTLVALGIAAPCEATAQAPRSRGGPARRSVNADISAGNVDAEAARAAAHKAILFARSPAFLDVIEQTVLRPALPHDALLRLDADVPMRDRAALAARFNSDDRVRVLLASSGVGGLGLNLSGADTVLFLEHDWNPANDAQAVDRAHRIGQRRCVLVQRFLCSDSIETRILSLQALKERAASAVVSPASALPADAHAWLQSLTAAGADAETARKKPRLGP